MERRMIDIKSVRKIDTMQCINKDLLNINGEYPDELFIKYILSPNLEEYINYTIYKRKNGNAIYQSTVFRNKIFLFNDKG